MRGTCSRRNLITASLDLSEAFLAKRGTSERMMSLMTKGRTVFNLIFSNWKSRPVMDRMATCLHEFDSGMRGEYFGAVSP